MEERDEAEVFALSKKRIKDTTMTREDLRHYLTEDFLGAIVAEKEGAVVGYCLYRTTKYDSEIDEIAVLKEEEGKGTASALMERTLANLDDGTRRFVYLEFRETNKRARFFYDKFGFEGYRRRLCYYSNGEDAFCFRKEIGRK